VVVLDDGKGTGRKAEVNPVNQLRVRATTHAEEHWVSETNGETYIASVAESGVTTLTFLTTEGGDVLHLINNSTTNLVISDIAVSASAAGGILTLTKNKTDGILTQNVTITPENLNFGSANIANVTANVWDETNGNGILGLSGGDVFRTLVVPNVLFVDTRGTIVVPQGKSITINYSNNIGSTIEFECAFRFYFDTEVTQ
jgi:hypothetical protein